MVCAALLGAAIAPAQAHKASDAYLSVEVRGTDITAQWDVHLRDLDNVLALDQDDDGRLTWGEVRQRWGDIDRAVWDRLAMKTGLAHCDVADAGQAPPRIDQHSDGTYAVLERRWHCDITPSVMALDYRLFADTDALHRGILRLHQSQPDGRMASPISAVLIPGAGERRFALIPATPWQTVYAFVHEGVSHIASGIDHLLFLLALLLPAVLRRDTASPGGLMRRPLWRAAPSWAPVLRDIFRVVTAFTLAHSITLALSVWGGVSPPSRWVESTIAASVVLAALNNLRPMVGEGRWVVTFAFGLVHGFGFASALRDVGLHDAPLGWSLLGFNLGVELGQLAVVAVFVPLAWALRETAFYQRRVLSAGSLAIAIVAALWLFERAADVSLGWLPG